MEFRLLKYSTAARDIDEIISRYLMSYHEINRMLELKECEEKIVINLIPTDALANRLLGRKLNYVKLEVNEIFIKYNAYSRATYFHELTHILTYRDFKPLDSELKHAIFEGLAVLMSHKQNVNRLLDDNDMAKTLEEIVKDVQIGKSYNAMGSFVFFLIHKLGVSGVFELIAEPEKFNAFNNEIKTLESEWKEKLKTMNVVKNKASAS